MSGKRVSTRLAQKAIPPPPPITTHEEDEDVEINDDDIDELDEDEEYDSEAEAQAEALARQMHDQLAAEIGKVYHFKSDGTADPIVPVMRHLLSIASNEPRLHSVLANTRIAEANQHSMLDMLSEYINIGHLSPPHAIALSRALLSLLDTPLLEELEPTTVIGKRKRDQREHSPLPPPHHPLANNTESRIRVAADTVYREILTKLEPGQYGQLSPAIKPQLGQIYQFATTYADAAEPSSSVILREISKLIKDTDILDRSQLAYPPVVDKDTSTAVFPCYRHPCSKLFTSTSTLTAHTRTHALPTTDSKTKLTPKVTITLQYQCDACKDLFPGRDALRKHQDNAGPACTDANVNVIEHREEMSADSTTITNGRWPNEPEDGELDPAMLVRAQDAVVRLQAPLKARAERARSAANAGRKVEEIELDELGTEVFHRTPVPKEAPAATSSTTSVPPTAPHVETDGEASVTLEKEESVRLEQAVLKLVEDAQAEAEAEIMLESGSDSAIDIDDGDE
jgi:hypothetical protein